MRIRKGLDDDGTERWFFTRQFWPSYFSVVLNDAGVRVGLNRTEDWDLVCFPWLGIYRLSVLLILILGVASELSMLIRFHFKQTHNLLEALGQADYVTTGPGRLLCSLCGGGSDLGDFLNVLVDLFRGGRLLGG